MARDKDKVAELIRRWKELQTLYTMISGLEQTHDRKLKELTVEEQNEYYNKR